MAVRMRFYALRSGLCVATAMEFANICSYIGFYALRSGLCVATSGAISAKLGSKSVSMPSEAGYA